MVQITIQIDSDNVAINQSAAPTKVEQDNKKFFIIMRESEYHETYGIEFVNDDYIKVANHLRCCNKWNNEDFIYKLYIQNENGTIMPCNGTEWDIDR